MSTPPTSKRPQARTLIRVDPSNPYAELGVSPLASTEEIKAHASKKRGELLGRRRSRSDGRSTEAEEKQIIRLQELEAMLGSAKARTAYDRGHPLTDLLTVQPGPRDLLLDPQQRGSLVPAWLNGELGSAAVLPSARSAWLYGGGELAPELLLLLREHCAAGTSAAGSASSEAANLGAAPVRATELYQISELDKPERTSER